MITLALAGSQKEGVKRIQGCLSPHLNLPPLQCLDRQLTSPVLSYIAHGLSGGQNVVCLSFRNLKYLH